MNFYDVAVKLKLVPDKNSLENAKKKMKEFKDVAERVKIQIEMQGANIAVANLKKIQDEINRIKKSKDLVGSVRLDNGKTAFVSKYGQIGMNKQDVVSRAVLEQDQRRLSSLKRSLNREELSAEKLSKTGDIMKGALMTIGYQFVNMIEAGAKKVIETSNKTLKIQSQMATLTQDKTAQKAFEADMYRIANQSFVDVNDVADLYTKIGLNAKHIGFSGGDVSKMTQSVFDIFSYSSVGKQQQQGAITQLTQTIAKGKNKALWMDIKFLEEDAPELANMIAEGLGIKEGLAGLKQAVQDGKVTGKQIGEALVKMSEKARKKFLESNKIRPEQAMTYISNKFKEMVSKHTETISKISKGVILIVDKAFSENGVLTKTINGIGNFVDSLDIDKISNDVEYILKELGYVLDVVGSIAKVLVQIGTSTIGMFLIKVGLLLYSTRKMLGLFSKIGDTVKGKWAIIGGVIDKMSKAPTIIGAMRTALGAVLGTTLGTTALVLGAILGTILLINDAWKTFTDENADTVFRRIYEFLKGIVNKIESLKNTIENFSNTIGGNTSDKINKVPENSLLGKINSFLPESIRNTNNGFTFMVNQTFNGNVDAKTAENYKQASKDMAETTRNDYVDWYMAQNTAYGE